jgi:plasmid stabilization system protein ParE
MKYFFHPAAQTEFADAVDFYERKQPGLGRRLSEEVQTAIRQICEHPWAWEKLDSQTHRFLTNRFPYGILYRIKGDHIRIIAVMHLRRNPESWQDR